jgi:putative lipoic acid-binding regulatory protein
VQFTDITSDETLMEFPCEFSVKAMGLNSPGFEETVVQIVRRHCSDLNEGCSRTRPSKNGKWVSVTVTMIATSKAQLDAIYMDLTAHEDVTMSI